MTVNVRKAPFPWFGGKSKAADVVWNALGDVPHYVEPFAGSLAVLLNRPHKARTETVNDLDCMIANFWRALKHDADGVALHCLDPVNEADLIARHIWLVNSKEKVRDRVQADPEFYDAKVAGWWCWGVCAWIGGGWCSGKGPWQSDGAKLYKRNAGRGVNRQLPHLGNAGQGVNRQLPHLGDAGQGVNRQLPHLGDAGRGVNRKLPHLGDAGRGDAVRQYLRDLSDRLSSVRVACGDWSRVVGTGVLSYPRSGPVGVFLDPPYLNEVRTANIYAEDDANTLAAKVRSWAIANGDDKRLRIVLAGLEDEHEAHMPEHWSRYSWSRANAYAGKNGGSCDTERLWLSPHCLRKDDGQMDLFASK